MTILKLKAIKTWRERIGAGEDFPLHAPTDVERAMVAEITELRSAVGMPEEWQQILDEVARATHKFPTWPTDPLHAIAVLGEEFGELTKAVLQTTYEPHKVKDGELHMEAIQTAAMALRFVTSLSSYEFTRCDQHSQAANQGTVEP